MSHTSDPKIVTGIHESASAGRVCLMEGAGGAVPYEVSYVLQDNKIWYACGKPDKLDESKSHLQLIEDYNSLELEERKLSNGVTTRLPKNGVWILEGPSQRSDTPNANKRSYGRAIWEKWIADPNSLAQIAIRERAMIGHLEHPKDGRTDGREGALLVIESTLRPDGVVWNKYELLDTPNGQILQEYTRKCVKWGVSSRGTGSVSDTGAVSVKDYQLETWDGVMRPSVDGAYPTLNQSVETGHACSVVAEADAVDESFAVDADVRRIINVVNSLTTTSLDGMDSDQRQELGDQIMENAKELLPYKGAAAAVHASFAKLCVIRESGGYNLDEMFEAAIVGASGVSESDVDVPDYREIIEDLQRRVAASAEDAESVRGKLEEAESRLLQSQKRADELSEQLSEAESESTTVCESLALAEELLAEMPDRVNDRQVDEAVECAIDQVPELDGYRDALSCASDADNVNALAEAFLPLVVTAAVQSEPVVQGEEAEAPPNRQVRPSVPCGAVMESEDLGPVEEYREPVHMSRGARIAASIVGTKK